MLLLSAATSYNGYDRSPARQGVDPAPIAGKHLEQAASQSYVALLQRHIDDCQAPFRRVALDLGTNEEVTKLGAVPVPSALTSDSLPGVPKLCYHFG